jgi:hypothetical protein
MTTDQPVFHTHGGRRYHATRNCPALQAGQDLWDTDDWSGYAIREETTQQAANRGKTPCVTCKPVVVDVPLFGETFGHEPVRDPIAGAHGWPQFDVCARCSWGDVYYDGSPVKERVSVAWPCTSAVVLGLVDAAVSGVR